MAAVLAGISVVSPGYGPKNAPLLEQGDVPPWSYDIASFSVDVVLRQLADALRAGAPGYGVRRQEYRGLPRFELKVLANG